MKYLILCLFLLRVSLSSQEYFHSNSLAMEFDQIVQIDNIDITSIDWLLKKELKNKEVIETLYNNGIESKRIIQQLNDYGQVISIKESSMGIIREEAYYQTDGKLKSFKTFYASGIFKYNQNYIYDDTGQLEQIIKIDSNDKIQSVMEFYIRLDGSIRSVQVYKNAFLSHSELWTSFDGELFMENRNIDSMRDLVFYDNFNRKTKIERLDGDALIYRELYLYYPENVLKFLEKTDFTSNVINKSYYNLDGLVVKEEFYFDESLAITIKSSYSDSKLVLREKISTSLKEKWIYTYNSDKKNKELYYKQGVLEQEKTYIDLDSNTYYITLFDKGEALMVLYFEDDVKIKEEFLDQGKVIKTRNLGASQ